jgi:hypothetical protein
MEPIILRKATFRFVRTFILLACLFFFSFSGSAQTNTWNGSVNTNWGTAGNWSLGVVPTNLHNVFIPNNFNVTVNVAAVCANLTINAGANANTITISGTNSLSVVSTVTINSGTGNGDDKSILIGAGSLSATTVVMATTGNDNRSNFITISTGTLTVRGNITMNDADPDRNYIQTTGTGIINLGGAISGGDLISATTSIFNYNGTVAQTVVAGGYQYGTLRLNNSNAAGATLGGTITGTIVTTDLDIQSGILNNGGFNVTLSAGDDFIMGVGTSYVLTGTSDMVVVSGGGVTTLATSSTVHYAGASQNIAQDTYGNLTISGSGNKLMNVNITVAGNFTMTASTLVITDDFFASYTMNVQGNFTHTGGTITENSAFIGFGNINFNGTAEQVFTSGGTVSNFVNFTVANGAYLQMAAEATVVNGNAFTVQAGGLLGIRSANGITNAPAATGNIRTTTRTYTAGASYIYNGTTNQVTGNGLTANTPQDLFIENPGNTVTLSAATTISGNLTIRLGTLAAGALALTVGGNWFNNGTAFNAGTGNVILNGAGLQTISGSTVTTFNNLNLNKTTGSVTLAQSINVNAALNIGVNLDIASNILTMGNNSPLIGTIGGTSGVFSATKMIIASGGGELRKNATTAAQATYAFPIGDNSGTAEYSPAGLLFAGGTYAGYVSLKVTDAKHPNLFHINNFLTRYWTVTQSGFSGFTATVGLNYVDADITGTETIIRMGKWDGAEPWTRFDPSITPASNLLNATVTSFSDFTGMSSLEALPVVLSSFTASLVNNTVQLKWTTAEEKNSSHYEIERSNDAVNFSKIGTVTSLNSLTGSTYNFTDVNPLSGKNYYRLRMVDIDGQFEYSEVKLINRDVTAATFRVYPNPVKSSLTVQLVKAKAGANIQIVDMKGQRISLIPVPEQSTLMNISVSGLIPGQYQLIYNNNGEQYMQKIIRQ